MSKNIARIVASAIDTNSWYLYGSVRDNWIHVSSSDEMKKLRDELLRLFPLKEDKPSFQPAYLVKGPDNNSRRSEESICDYVDTEKEAMELARATALQYFLPSGTPVEVFKLIAEVYVEPKTEYEVKVVQ